MSGVALGAVPALLGRRGFRAPENVSQDLVLGASSGVSAGIDPIQTGVLGEDFYAAHVYLLAADTPVGAAAETQDEEMITELAGQVNRWFARQLCDRQMRFLYRGPVPSDLLGAMHGVGGKDLISRLPAALRREGVSGGPQQIRVYLVKDLPGVEWVAPWTVCMSLPNLFEEVEHGVQAGRFAHLIGHALGLDHPRPDIDTDGTAFASEHSFMHPDVALRGLDDCIILDSPLNHEKARLVHSGFFPYRGRVYTWKDGAIPLAKGMLIEGQGREIKIAHGNYVVPCDPRQAVVTVRGDGLVLDLGGALLRGSTVEFKEFGEHPANGIGVMLDGVAGQRIGLRGGIISGYHYGVKAVGLLSGQIEGVSVVDNRRLWSDARRGADDGLRGAWLSFWATPEDDATEAWPVAEYRDTFLPATGAGVVLVGCKETTCGKLLATHNTVGVADYYGQSNRHEGNDLSGCSIGLRLWGAHGSPEKPIRIAGNVLHFNTQPCPWWWSGGDGAGIIGIGVEACEIRGNEIAFGGDGVWLSGFPRLPAQAQDILIAGNTITHAYAHGIEVDFVQDCIVQENEISGSWLSGIWAGHTAGLLAANNLFAGNNRGRLYAGWTDSQGAISCPEGRCTVAGNRFIGNWVAVNLWRNYQLPWFLFAGDATRHIVTGNTFLDNQIAVRMAGVRLSSIERNVMRGNSEDVVGDLADNDVSDNGPDVEPAGFTAVHVPVERLLFGGEYQVAEFAICSVTASGVTPIVPQAVDVLSAEPQPWLRSSVGADGAIHVTASPGDSFQGVKLATLRVQTPAGEHRIGAKFVGGDGWALVGTGDPQRGPAEVLGRTPVGPFALLGVWTPLSTVLRSEQATGLTCLQAFWCQLTQPDFRPAAGAVKYLGVILSDDEVRLSFGDGASILSSPPPKPGQPWEWTFDLLDIAEIASHGRIEYTHRRAGPKDGIEGCLVLWLYPLDEDDLARLPDPTRAPLLGEVPEAGRFTMPGTRRFWRPRP